MTVQKLYDELGNYIKMGHADTRVIANCDFHLPWECKKHEHINGFYLTNLDKVYYQSGDIELGFYSEFDFEKDLEDMEE